MGGKSILWDTSKGPYAPSNFSLEALLLVLLFASPSITNQSGRLSFWLVASSVNQ